MIKDPRFTLTRRQAFGLLGLGGVAAAAACDSSSVAPTAPTHQLLGGSAAGGAFLINATPYSLTFTVNNGTATGLQPFRGASGATGYVAASENAYSVPRSATLQTDVFASSSGGTQNALFVSTAPYGPDAFYVISVNTPLSNDLYIWLFLDQAIGLDQGGSSLGIQVQRTT